MQNLAKELNAKYGWNIIPMYYLTRNDDGTKEAKMPPWEKYKAEPYPLDKWDDSYKALAITTGPLSNLSILDIDSEEALSTILDTLKVKLEDLAEYIVKTNKGYQLFYSYLPNSSTTISIRDKIDFLSGGITFAVSCNEGYSVIKDNTPQPMPDPLKGLILDSETEAKTDDIKEFEELLRKNSDLPYLNPLQPIIKKFTTASRITKNIREPLERVFCTKHYKDYELSDFSKKGQIHASMMYVAGIVASNPTINKDLYIKFMDHWAKTIAKIDVSDHKEQQNIKNRIKGGMKYFTYNEQWKDKSESMTNVNNLAQKSNRSIWYDPELDKYVIKNHKLKSLVRYSKPSFKDEICRDYNQDPNNEGIMTTDMVDVSKVIRRFETFDPTVDGEFFIDEHGKAMHNNFERSGMLKYFQECEPKDTMPEFIGNIVYHLYPVEEERDLFLHTLAYHMTYLQVSPTTYVLTGKSGTGKNTLMKNVLEEIYGDMHTTISADTLTGRFRNLLRDKLLVFIDEVSEKHHKPTERGSIHNVIKQIVANPIITIEAKGRDENTYPNHALYVMATNKDIPFRLEEGFDRRVNITKTKDDNIRDLPWFPKISSMEINDLVISEVKGFVEYLASIDLDHIKWATTIENSQRKTLISSSVPIVEQYTTAILDKNVETLYELDHDFAEYFEQHFIRDNEATDTVRNLKVQLGDVGVKVIKLLKASGVKQKLVDNNRSLVINPKGHDKKTIDAFEGEAS